MVSFNPDGLNNPTTTFSVSNSNSGASKTRVSLQTSYDGITPEVRKSISNLMNIHCKGEIKAKEGQTPKLSLIDRFRWTAIKVKDENNNDVWLKVNKESLRKRLGMSSKEFSENIKDGVFDLTVIQQRMTNQAVVIKQLAKFDYTLKAKNEFESPICIIDSNLAFFRTLLEKKTLDPATDTALRQFCDKVDELKKNPTNISKSVIELINEYKSKIDM